MGEYAILTDIGLKVIIYIEYILLASGLYLQMCGVEFFNKHFTAEKRKRRIYHYLIETGIRIVVIGLRCPVIVYLALIYGMVIISLRILHVYTYQHAIRGMTAIILMEMMELAYTLFGGNERLGFVGHNIRIEYNLQTLVMILLLMMVQVTVTIAGEAWRLRTRKNKYFYLVIGMKRIMEALLCYRMMELTDFANSNLPYVLMLICSILLDYVLIYDIEMYKVFRREEIRRIQTPLNREQYYVKMEEEHLKIRRMFHDMKNQLMILEGNPAFQTEQAQNVITGFRKEMDSLGGFYHTGNADLDLILFDCRSRALEKNIAFDAIIQEGCLSFMKQEDINAIFV
ncbi:MAG: hypothetical protein Q4B22_11435, partial [Eubacteriales bacterium]|nr:hypothetical protein [Eubacteriales bacterium]